MKAYTEKKSDLQRSLFFSFPAHTAASLRRKTPENFRRRILYVKFTDLTAGLVDNVYSRAESQSVQDFPGIPEFYVTQLHRDEQEYPY